MICTNCGYNNEEGNQFCKQCGNSLKKEGIDKTNGLNKVFEQNNKYQKDKLIKHNIKFCPSCGCKTDEQVPYCLKCGMNFISTPIATSNNFKNPKCPRCEKDIANNQDKCFHCGMELTSPLEKLFKISAVIIWVFGLISAGVMSSNYYYEGLDGFILFILFMYIMGGLIFFGIGEIIRQLYQINIYNTFKTNKEK